MEYEVTFEVFYGAQNSDRFTRVFVNVECMSAYIQKMSSEYREKIFKIFVHSTGK